MSLAWQYILIFLGVAIEGPAVTLTAAALAGAGLLNLSFSSQPHYK